MSERRYVKRMGPYIDSIPFLLKHQIPTSKTERFWRGLAEGKIYAARCRKCGSVYFPPQADCPLCMADDMEWVELPRSGTLETFTKIYSKPQGYEEFDPYIVAIASLDNGVKLMGWLDAKDEKCIKVGDKVLLDISYIDKHKKYIIIFKLQNKKC